VPEAADLSPTKHTKRHEKGALWLEDFWPFGVNSRVSRALSALGNVRWLNDEALMWNDETRITRYARNDFPSFGHLSFL